MALRVIGLVVVVSAVVLGLASRGPSFTHPPDQRLSSRYLALESDREVAGRATLLSTSVTLKRPATLLLHSDGTFAPRTVDAAAKVYVNVDGRQIGN